MREWVIERGIGESRYALIENEEIIEARIELADIIPAGTVVEARLIDTGRAGRNAIAKDLEGQAYLLPLGAAGTTQGASLLIQVTRSAIPGAEPWKRPLARVVTDRVHREAATEKARGLTSPDQRDELGRAGWYDLIEQARSGIVTFAGGELRISPTPAMTLIDVDGVLPPEDLAITGAAAAASAIRRLDIGGSIGIDLPTGRSKTARQQAAASIDAVLPAPFERTAVNGFGFVQIVRPRRRASIIELAADRRSFEARALLRQASMAGPGPKRLVSTPSVIHLLEDCPQWLEALSRQIGGSVSLRADANLAMSAGYAEPTQ